MSQMKLCLNILALLLSDVYAAFGLLSQDYLEEIRQQIQGDEAFARDITKTPLL